MPISTAKNICLYLALIAATCLPGQIAMAGDSNFLSRIYPLISLNKNIPHQELQSFSTSKKPHVDGYQVQGENYAPPVKKNMSDQDLFSLALGARFQISEWLGVDAACRMPLAEEEPVWGKDMAIEAMVTMHF